MRNGSQNGQRHFSMGSFYEFFAGGGMARLGLGDAWTRL
jgi:hypothetical protein